MAANVTGVGGSRSDDVWAVGASGSGFHYDGSGWAASPTGTIQPLASVWSDSPEDAWAVGAAGTVLRWNGATWQE
jgi:hypothetical protein